MGSSNKDKITFVYETRIYSDRGSAGVAESLRSAADCMDVYSSQIDGWAKLAATGDQFRPYFGTITKVPMKQEVEE